MSDFQTEMNRTVQDFVAQISELARLAAVNTLESAFDSKGGRRSGAAAALIALTGNGRVGRPRGGRDRYRANGSAGIIRWPRAPRRRAEQLLRSIAGTGSCC